MTNPPAILSLLFGSREGEVSRLGPPILEAAYRVLREWPNLAVLVPRSATLGDAQLQEAVDAVNAGLPDYARVHRWLRAAQPFGEANGLATANGRLRRAALVEHYRGAIETMAAALS